jgi:hypothetical protein
MSDPFCLSTVLPTSGTQVWQAESDHSSANSIFDMGIFGSLGDLPTVITSTGKVISNVIPGHEDSDQQNLIDADPSLLASGYNSGALGSDRLLPNQNSARARGAWALDRLQAGGTNDTCRNLPFEHKRPEHGDVPEKQIFESLGDLPMVINSTGEVISNVIPGHEDIDQQNLIDADTSLLGSGFNSGALGPNRLSPNQDSARARGAWALDRHSSTDTVQQTQIDRHRSTDTDRQTQINRHRSTYTDRQTQIDRHRSADTDRQTQIDRHSSTDTDRQTQIDRHRSTDTDRYM